MHVFKEIEERSVRVEVLVVVATPYFSRLYFVDREVECEALELKHVCDTPARQVSTLFLERHEL